MNRSTDARPTTAAARVVDLAVGAMLLLAGLAHWFVFLGRGRGSFAAYDWPHFLSHLQVLGDALRGGVVPLYVEPPLQHHGVTWFLGSPEVPCAPQHLLLLWLDEPSFVLVEVLLYCVVGFAGCLALRRRLSLSWLATAILWALVVANGHLTAHLGVGHLNWVGCLLLPWFVDQCIRLTTTADGGRAAAGLAIVLAGLSWQGSFQQFNMAVLFLVLLAVARPALWRPVALAVAAGCGLAAFRLLPAAATFGLQGQRFASGYPTLLDLLEGLTVIRDRHTAPRGGFHHAIHWWELDAYVGVLGALLLAVGLVSLAASRSSRAPWQALGLPIVASSLFALGDVGRLLTALPLPLVNAQRVSARFFVLPLVFAVVLGVDRLQRALDRRPGAAPRLALAAAGIVLVNDLAQHSRTWAIPAFDDGATVRPSHRIVGGDAPLYEAAVVAGALTSALAVAAVAFWILRQRRRLAPA